MSFLQFVLDKMLPNFLQGPVCQGGGQVGVLAEVVRHNEHLQGGAEAAAVGLPLLFTRRTHHTEHLGTLLYSKPMRSLSHPPYLEYYVELLS